MAVTLNNYYAGEETPDEAILDYLVPKAQATSEAESETETEEPKPKSQKQLWPLLLLSLQMLLM